MSVLTCVFTLGAVYSLHCDWLPFGCQLIRLSLDGRIDLPEFEWLQYLRKVKQEKVNAESINPSCCTRVAALLCSEQLPVPFLSLF